MDQVAPDHGLWIDAQLTGKWGSVTGVTPDGFDCYVRILHSIDFGSRDIRWSDVAAATGRQVHPLVQWWRLIDADEPLNPTSTIWPSSDEPQTGELPYPDAIELYTRLASATTTPDEILFGFWTGYAGYNGAQVWVAAAQEMRTGRQAPPPTTTDVGELHLPGRSYGLAQGSLGDALAVANHLHRDGTGFGPVAPNLMWPADISWFVASEIDFDSTLVGCNSTTASALLASDQLEAYPVTPNDSLQFDADTINT